MMHCTVATADIYTMSHEYSVLVVLQTSAWGQLLGEILAQ